MSDTDGVHVVFGTGAIGLALVDELHASGKDVRAVSRGGAEVPRGVEIVRGDASDGEFATMASVDAAVVYSCVNAPYAKWSELFPPMQEALIAGAASADAKLVVTENLYMYGPANSGALTENLAHSATTRKGRIRAQMTHDLCTAHTAGKVRVAVGRASDYFGPRGTLSAMGERVFYPALAGKKVQLMGDPDQPHTYSYLPDIAKGLAVLGDSADADGQAWHLPNPATVTTTEFIDLVGNAAGTQPGISTMPRSLMNVVGLFNSNVRELKEMLYEFEEPFIVDHSRFELAFGNHTTDLPEAIDSTVNWFRNHPKRP